MNKILLSLLLFYMPFIALSQGINFESGNFNSVLNKAKVDNKLIFVDCYTTWCAPCKWLAANVFTDNNVGEFYNQNFVNFKLDMEKGEGKDFKTNYGVAAYPTLLFLNPDGSIEHKALGALDTTGFLRLGQTALDTNQNLGSFIRRYNSGNRDIDFLAEYATICYNTGTAYNIREYFDLVETNKLIEEKNLKLIELYISDINSREFNYIIRNRNIFYNNYPEARINNYIRNTFVKQIYAQEKSLDTKNLRNHTLKMLRPYSLNDSINLASKIEMDYHLNRSRNWERYVELIKELENNEGVKAFSFPEWINIIESIVLYANNTENMLLVDKYYKFLIDADFNNHKFYLISGLIEYKKGIDNKDKWIEKAKEAAKNEGILEIQLDRLIRIYFPQ